MKVFLKVGNCDLNVLKLLRRVYAGVTCTATTMILSTIVYTLKLIEKMNPHPTYQSAQLGFSIASSISAVVTAVIWLLAISLFIRQLPNMMDVKPTSVNSINYTVNESKLFLYNVLLGAQTMSNRTFSAFQRPRDLQNFLDSAQLFHASLSFETAQASSTSTACEVNTQSSSSHMHGAATAPTENISTTAHDGLACATQAVPGAAEEPKLTQKVFDSMMKESEEQGCVNTAKLQYLSCIAHELRTPLQSLCYTLDLLLLTKLPADNSATMNQALVAVDLMKASISQTMDVGKVLSGVKLAPRLAIVSLSTIIAKVEFMMYGSYHLLCSFLFVY